VRIPCDEHKNIDSAATSIRRTSAEEPNVQSINSGAAQSMPNCGPSMKGMPCGYNCRAAGYRLLCNVGLVRVGLVLQLVDAVKGNRLSASPPPVRDRSDSLVHCGVIH
jgi:hypothetical protein